MFQIFELETFSASILSCELVYKKIINESTLFEVKRHMGNVSEYLQLAYNIFGFIDLNFIVKVMPTILSK